MMGGKLRHTITIETLANSSTELTGRGQTQSPSWGRTAQVRASIEPLRGNEAFQARQVYATATHKIKCRYAAGVTSKSRGRFGGRTFQFLEVRNMEERNRELEIIATEEL